MIRTGNVKTSRPPLSVDERTNARRTKGGLQGNCPGSPRAQTVLWVDRGRGEPRPESDKPVSVPALGSYSAKSSAPSGRGRRQVPDRPPVFSHKDRSPIV